MTKFEKRFIPFKRIFFFHYLKTNVKRILNNKNLSNQEKGNRIYYDVFWKTWHECGEPSLYHMFLSLMSIQSHFTDILNELNYQYPKKNMQILKQFKEQHYPTAQVGLVRIGCLAKDIDYVSLRQNLWHFGNTPHLQKCLHLAFDKLHWYQIDGLGY